MSRNKYPEETYQLILEVSMKLFITQGYEKTSLQDIISHLGGLTKGAIYHHFKSKEDILMAVVSQISQKNSVRMIDIRDNSTLSGKEKLEKMFSESLQHPSQGEIFSITPNLLDNPTFLTYYLKILVQEVIPEYVTPIIQQGVADGSIQTPYPEALSSLIMFLSDVWLNPLIFQMSDEEMVQRASLLNHLLLPFGIRLFTDSDLQKLSEYLIISRH